MAKRGKSIPSEWPSMSAAAAGLGLPIEILRLAKRHGCDAFRASGRVVGAKLTEWIKANPEKVKELADGSIKDKKTYEEWRRLKIANDAKDRILILRSEVVEKTLKCGERIRPMLAQKLLNEYPAAVAGLDVPQCRIFGQRLLNAILQEWVGIMEDAWR